MTFRDQKAQLSGGSLEVLSAKLSDACRWRDHGARGSTHLAHRLRDALLASARLPEPRSPRSASCPAAPPCRRGLSAARR